MSGHTSKEGQNLARKWPQIQAISATLSPPSFALCRYKLGAFGSSSFTTQYSIVHFVHFFDGFTHQFLVERKDNENEPEKRGFSRFEKFYPTMQ